MEPQGTILKLLAQARAAARRRAYYSAGGATVALAASDPEPIAWTDRYLAPYACAPVQQPALSVVFSTDAGMLTAIARRLYAAAAPRRVPFYLYREALRFDLGVGVVLLPLVPSRLETSVDASLPARELYVAQEREIYAFIDPAERRDSAPEAARLVRDAITKDFLARDELLLHAAAIGAGGAGIALSGDKGAGKSTVLLAALRRFSADLIANDRIHVHPATGGYALRQWPAASAFFPHSLEAHGVRVGRDLSPAYPQRPFWKDGAAGEARKVGLLLPELAALFGARVAERAPLRYVFLISRSGGAGGRVVRCDDPAFAYAFLARQRFDASERLYPDPFGLAGARRPVAEDPLWRLCREPSIAFYHASGVDTSQAILEFLDGLLVARARHVRAAESRRSGDVDVR